MVNLRLDDLISLRPGKAIGSRHVIKAVVVVNRLRSSLKWRHQFMGTDLLNKIYIFNFFNHY